ncbi:hypothetical protein H5410_045189, partial [Solanum commersonii]
HSIFRGINARGNTLDWASVSGAISTLVSLEPSVEVSVNDVSMIDCTIASSKSGRCSSSVSASDSAAATSSIVSSSVVAGGISELAETSAPGTSGTFVDSNSEVKSMGFRWSTSFLNLETSAFKVVTLPHVLFDKSLLPLQPRPLAGKPAHRQNGLVALRDWEKVEEPGSWEGVEVNVPEGPEAGVGKTAYTGRESTSTSEDMSIGAALFLSTLSRAYSASMRRMSVKDMGVTSTSLFSSKVTLARRHNSVKSTGMKGMFGNAWPSWPSPAL